MYNIKTANLSPLMSPSKSSLKEKSPKIRVNDKKKTGFLLKKKSTVYNPEKEFNLFENQILDSPFKKKDGDFQSTFAISMQEFNSNDFKTAQNFLNEKVFFF